MNNKVLTPGPPPGLDHLDHVGPRHRTEGYLGMSLGSVGTVEGTVIFPGGPVRAGSRPPWGRTEATTHGRAGLGAVSRRCLKPRD